MRCPFCRNMDDRVIDSRLSKDGDLIRRRRECAHCQRRFTTYERVEETLPLVIKKDGRRELFDRGKILNGLQKACEKRPISVTVLEKLIERIEQRLQESGEREVLSREIGEQIMLELQSLDEVAYVRFASVYRSFKDVNEFMSEVKELLEKGQKNKKEALGAIASRRIRFHMTEDERYMRLALSLARKGLGTTSPNPMVGAVVVKGKTIVGQGIPSSRGRAPRRNPGPPPGRGEGSGSDALSQLGAL